MIIEGKDNMNKVRWITLLSSAQLEVRTGMRISRGMKATAIAKQLLGLPKTCPNQKALDGLQAIVDAIHRGEEVPDYAY